MIPESPEKDNFFENTEDSSGDEVTEVSDPAAAENENDKGKFVYFCIKIKSYFGQGGIQQVYKSREEISDSYCFGP